MIIVIKCISWVVVTLIIAWVFILHQFLRCAEWFGLSVFDYMNINIRKKYILEVGALLRLTRALNNYITFSLRITRSLRAELLPTMTRSSPCMSMPIDSYKQDITVRRQGCPGLNIDKGMDWPQEKNCFTSHVQFILALCMYSVNLFYGWTMNRYLVDVYSNN